MSAQEQALMKRVSFYVTDILVRRTKNALTAKRVSVRGK